MGVGVPEQARPLGISVLAVLAALGCAIGILILLGVTGSAGDSPGATMGWIALLLLVVGSGATAYGLWTLRWWAWPVALLVWVSSAVQAPISLLNGTLSTDLVVAPLAIGYLCLPRIRSAFGVRVGSPSRDFLAATVTLVVLAAAAPVATAAASTWQPTVPAAAGTTLVAHVELARPDTPAPGTDVSADDVTVEAADCLSGEQRPAGWLDLCWSVTRVPDGDPAGDDYHFEARGTFASGATRPGAASGPEIRWVVLRARLLVPVVDGVSSAEPDGVAEGCGTDTTILIAPFGTDVPEHPCDGRTVGRPDLQGQTVTWTCLGCLLGADQHERVIGLAQDVKVGQGIIPSWDLYADVGS